MAPNIDTTDPNSASNLRSLDELDDMISSTKPDEPESMWALKFKITNRKQNFAQWNKDWEKALASLKASEVFVLLAKIWPEVGDEQRSYVQSARDSLIKKQEAAKHVIQGAFTDGHFETMWVLLEESERKKYIFKGLEGACTSGGWGEDGRALCPEIVSSMLLKESGQPFYKLLCEYLEAMQSATELPVMIPSAWWDKALDETSRPLTEKDHLAYQSLSVKRHEFIAFFVMYSVTYFLGSIAHKTEGMKPVIDIMKNVGPSFAAGLAATRKDLRDKPIIRCENCTLGTEELGPNIRFMVCSACRSKLNFDIHYCPQKCQAGDWPRHKKHCGKKKVSKGLPGTAGDRMWAFKKVPNLVKEIPTDSDGCASITSLGSGTAHYPRSAALKRQMSMIDADKSADYFLFNEGGQPVRFAVHDFTTKLTFRILRLSAMSEESKQGLEAIAQYMIKIMGHMPSLSRHVILRQLNAEYGDDTETKLIEFESKGPDDGRTFLELMSRTIAADFPRIMSTPGLGFRGPP